MIIEQFKKSNVSCVFMLPLLKIGKAKLNLLGFKDTYLFNGEESVVYEDCIHLLFEPPSLSKFNNFLADERHKKAPIVEENDYEGGLVLVTYRLPPRFKSDYELIWEGKYSETSAEYQQVFPKTVQLTTASGILVTEMSGQHMVFSRYQPMKRKLEEELGVELPDNQELWTKPTIERETFKLKNHEPTAINA